MPTSSQAVAPADKATAGQYACPCLNIVLDINGEEDDRDRTIVTKEEASVEERSIPHAQEQVQLQVAKLTNDAVAGPSSRITVDVAQPPLTSQWQQTSSATQSAPMTMVTCLSCGHTIYGVDQVADASVSALHLSPKAEADRALKTIGFIEGAGSAVSKKSDASQATKPPVIIGTKQLGPDVVRPMPGRGSMYIKAGSIQGADSISALKSLAGYSKTYGLVITRNLARYSSERTQRDTERVPSTARRLLSPDYQMHNRGIAASSDSSPSPARRRRHARVLEAEEEEDSEDLDTMQLISTLLPRPHSSIFQDSTNGTDMTSSRTRSPGRLTSAERSIETHLDSVALKQLSDYNAQAQRDLYDFVKQKIEGYRHLERELEAEARSLCDQAKSVLPSVESTIHPRHASLVPPSAGQEKQVDMLDEEQSFPRRRPIGPRSVATSAIASSSLDPNMTSAEPVLQNGSRSAGATQSQLLPAASSTKTGPVVGSYLSASFAMRGRDLPHPVNQRELSKEDEEEWFAAKRRLRERYPHADHSALPSAVNSDDESDIQVKAEMPASLEEERGRGRGRTSVSRVEQSNEGRSSRTRSRSGEQRRSSGTKARAEGTLNSKKGALKNTTPRSTDNEKSANSSSTEKKVAFASVHQEVEAPPPPRTEISQHAEGNDEAFFEIDEDLDAEEATPNSSDILIGEKPVVPIAGALEQLKLNEQSEGSTAPSGGEEMAQQIAQSLSMTGSLSAMVASEMRKGKRSVDDNLLSASLMPGFDPASLRFDGGEVYSEPQQSAASRRASTTHDSLPANTIRSPHTSQKSKTSDDNLSELDLREAMLAGFPDIASERRAIGFRVSVGDAEARLSGLLAPNAPSHRSLWSRRPKQRMVTPGSDEEDLDDVAEDEEDEEGKGEDEAKDSSSPRSKNQAGSPQHSAGRRDQHLMPAKMRQPSQEPDESSMLARSVPIHVAQSPGRRSVSTSVYRDKTSGFDLEPKTSLPYREKRMTPSLLKAARRTHRNTAMQGGHASKRPSLGAISDTSEQTSSMSTSAHSSEPPKTVKSVRRPSVVSPTSSFKYSVPPTIPGSVQRGFDPLAAGTSAPVGAIDLSNTALPTLVPGLPLPTRSAYVRPPPPTSSNLRLEPDDKHRPASLPLAPYHPSDEPSTDEAGTKNVDKILTFMHTLENLKRNKRTGWYHHRVLQPESIADHMYRMGVLSMLLPNGNLDIGKCVQLCLVHDIAESLVGDLTPLDNVPKEEKHRREHDALLHLVHDLLGSSVAALRLEQLWNEYEERQTPESRAVKDLDRFELALQAVEYERQEHTVDLQPFFQGCTGDVEHPRIKLWLHQLAREREELWSKTKYKYTQEWPHTADQGTK